MKDARIHKIATFPDLMNDDLEFQNLMQTSSHKQAKTTEPQEVAAEAQNKAIGPAKPSNTVALMQEEERARGSVGLSAYMAFVRASGTILNFFIVLFVLVIAQGSNILTSLWLSWWSSNRFANISTVQYIDVYAALGVVQALLMFAYATTLTTFSTRAAKNMLNSAISHSLRAPMLFFATTPIGRVTNRFSKVVDTMDNRLTDNLRFLLYIIATVVSVFCLVIAYFYYFILALIPLTVAFIFAASFYRASAREIKRHEAVLRSFVFASFSEAITGTTTIRAYGVEIQFLSTIVHLLDSMNGAYFLTFAGQRWLSTLIDALGSLLVFVVGIIVTSRFDVKPAISGLVLS
jgi:ABC-type bacteriocin/lantibiotic exporter with double-glycine peptidase domain